MNHTCFFGQATGTSGSQEELLPAKVRRVVAVREMRDDLRAYLLPPSCSCTVQDAVQVVLRRECVLPRSLHMSLNHSSGDREADRQAGVGGTTLTTDRQTGRQTGFLLRVTRHPQCVWRGRCVLLPSSLASFFTCTLVFPTDRCLCLCTRCTSRFPPSFPASSRSRGCYSRTAILASTLTHSHSHTHKHSIQRGNSLEITAAAPLDHRTGKRLMQRRRAAWSLGLCACVLRMSPPPPSLLRLRCLKPA